MVGCRFAPVDKIPSWLGRLPGTIGGTTHTFISQVVIAKLLGHDAVTSLSVAEQRIILYESAVS